ncbi:uL15 family ribosomal protein [Candidatus Micrarchaeota archaeon]|nr:uL15 family ribosomal protein [Candidatus Micrarchaeota archaeon]MBU1930752.1 uL15 family ribosomal protein [Candidatus Micrarchaeota archaeon]
MVVRKRRRSNKKRGGRTQHGNTKHWRGAGSRGGRGRAGSHKHKYSKYYDAFGHKIRLKPKKKPEKAINLGKLNELIPGWLERKKCEKNAQGQIVLNGKKIGITKVLGGGSLSFKVVFQNIVLSKKAQEKIPESKQESHPKENNQEEMVKDK